MNQRRNDQLEEDPPVATYAQFSALKPPFFHKAEEPLEADDWLRAIEASWMFSPCPAPRSEMLSLQQCISVVRHCFGGIISR
jgi:hypothetical protein